MFIPFQGHPILVQCGCLHGSLWSESTRVRKALCNILWYGFRNRLYSRHLQRKCQQEEQKSVISAFIDPRRSIYWNMDICSRRGPWDRESERATYQWGHKQMWGTGRLTPAIPDDLLRSTHFMYHHHFSVSRRLLHHASFWNASCWALCPLNFLMIKAGSSFKFLLHYDSLWETFPDL